MPHPCDEPSLPLPAGFRVVSDADVDRRDGRRIVLVPSHAFGDGRHETTQMCLAALAAFAPPPPFRLLDVGSGTGILSIAAALLGGDAFGVEIDDTANAVARENARLSGVADRAAFGTAWPEGRFDVVVANILRGVLVALADEIAGRIAPGGLLVLSGVVSTDVPELVARYAPQLRGARPEIFERGPWRALAWRRCTPSPRR
jgi:ribosomal protein L11 methyltransferase